MRALALIALATGCIDSPHVRISGCDLVPLPGECVDSTHPFRFGENNPQGVARGGGTNIRFVALEGLDFDIRSTNPGVLEVARTGNGFIMIGLGEGEATLDAVRADTGALLASAAVTVAAIDRVGFAFDPAGDDVLPRLAALPGASERIRVHAFGGDLELAGADSLVVFLHEGGILPAAYGNAEARYGRFDLFAPTNRTGFETAIEIAELGPARLVARVGGVDVGALAIDVVAQADAIALTLGHASTVTDYIEVASLTGTAGGLPLAGIVADFTVAPPGLVKIADSHAGELSMFTLAPGSLAITATLPDRVLATQLEIQPR